MHGECGGVQVLLQSSVRRVVNAEAALFFHNLALRGEVFLIHIKAAEAVGFEPEDAREIIARKRLPEDRDVVVGIGIIEAANRFDDA